MGVVVIDFGLANLFMKRTRPGGTPGYMPPEVWDYGLWTPKGDVFSIGVMIYSMRVGKQPFVEGCRTLEEVQQCTREYGPQMPKGSLQLRTLVDHMLDKSFHTRPAIGKVMDDKWFFGGDASQVIDDSVLAALTRRRQDTELKKAVLADLASNRNLAQMRELNELFLELDDDHDGIVKADEVRRVLADQWPQDRIDRLISALLGGDDGEVNYEEFMGQLIAAAEPAENELLWRVFNEVDRENKGFLDLEDIRVLLQRPAVAKVLGDRDPAALLREMDRDKKNKVSFEDFKNAMQGPRQSGEITTTDARYHG